jgi:hypothetical protein
MPLPPGVGTFTLTADFPPLSPDGTERQGSFTFTPIPDILVADSGVYLGVENATLSASGTLSKVLVANDALAEPFVWRVDIDVTGLPPISQNISVPASAGTVALGTLLETEALPGNYYVVVGPQGPQGEPGSGGGGGTPSSTVTGSTSYGQSATAGAASTYSRGDHVHGSPSLASSAATSSAVGDVAAVGVGTTPARADHVHGREAFGAVTAQTSFGASSGSGSAATPARSDHTHGTPTAPTVGTTAGTYAAGDDSRITGAAQKAQNLADLANAGTARTNLGLGTAATQASGAFDASGAAATAQAAAIGAAATDATTKANAAQSAATAAAIADAASKYVALTGTQVISGEKTFNDAIPVLPATDPAFDNQAARKAYVDAQAAVVGAVTVSGAAASGKVLTASSSSAATWQTPSGGGGSSIRTARVTVTDDNLSGLPSAAAWTIAQTSAATKLQCSIAAAVDDRIRVVGRFMRAGSHFLDWALLDNTGAIAVYASTDTSSPLSEGDPAEYPSLSFSYDPGPPMFTVSSGHISGGLVTVALVHQGTGSGVVYAHSTYPWKLRLENIGPEPA